MLAAALQGALSAAIILALTLAPNEVGRNLLVPIDGAPIDKALIARLMLQPVGAGPLPGSVVVDGRGRSLVPELIEKGIVMMAAPAVLCGDAWSPGVTRND